MDMAMELELQVGNDQSKHQTNPTKGEEKEIKEDNQEEQVENGQSEQEERLPNSMNGEEKEIKEENQEEQVENGESEQEEQLPNPTVEGLTTEDEKEERSTTEDEKEEKIISVVLRANLRCDRCKTRLLKDISREHGVNSISIDENNIRVTGNMDPIGLRKRTASVNLVSVHDERPPLEREMVSSLGLLLSVNYLLAALGGKRSAMLAKVRCSLHGRNEAEGELVEGMWEFHCPECPPEKLA